LSPLTPPEARTPYQPTVCSTFLSFTA
jgi:hypothetical protein